MLNCNQTMAMANPSQPRTKQNNKKKKKTELAELNLQNKNGDWREIGKGLGGEIRRSGVRMPANEI